MATLTAGNLSSATQVAPKANTTRLVANYTVPTTVAPQAKVAVHAEVETTQPTVQSAASQLEQVQRALEKLKQSIKPNLANSLKFEIDQSSGKTVVKVMDAETQAIVRQIPSEELLVIARALDSMEGRGGLVRQKA